VCVHLAREHAAELENLDFLREALHLLDEVGERALVVFLARELVQLCSFVERLLDSAQRADDGLELGALAAQGLRPLLLGPDRRILELAVDLFEALALDVIVKDTSAVGRSAL
jgi:hypothetical protein